MDWIRRIDVFYKLNPEFSGGPVGLETLAASIGEDSGTLEDVYEPYLLQNGFLNRTPRGRMASVLAYTHLGYPRPDLSTK